MIVRGPSGLFRRHRARRGWALLTIAGFVLLIVVFVDHRLKQAPHAGFVPANAEILITADDFPAAWAAFGRSPTFNRISSEASQVPHKLGVWSRRETLVRWTPARWGAWFGQPVLIARTPAGAGICTHPGLLVRFALGVAKLTGRVSDRGDVSELGSLHFAWRDGYLVVGNSETYVRSSIRSNNTRSFDGEPTSVSLEWTGSPKGRLRAWAERSLRLEGRVAIHAESPPATRMLVEQWPNPPMVAVAGSGGRTLVDLAADHWPAFPAAELVEDVFDEFVGRLPSHWDEHADTFAFAVLSLDISNLLAVPEAALVVRSRRQFPELQRPRSAIPYQWSGVTGWMEPWLGERLAVYFATSDRLRVMTNQEATMAALLSRSRIGRITASDLTVRVDCTAVGQVLKPLIRNAAAHELLPRRNREDAERDLIPIAEALSQLGVLRIEGAYDDESLAFAGEFVWDERESHT